MFGSAATNKPMDYSFDYTRLVRSTMTTAALASACMLRHYKNHQEWKNATVTTLELDLMKDGLRWTDVKATFEKIMDDENEVFFWGRQPEMVMTGTDHPITFQNERGVFQVSSNLHWHTKRTWKGNTKFNVKFDNYVTRDCDGGCLGVHAVLDLEGKLFPYRVVTGLFRDWETKKVKLVTAIYDCEVTTPGTTPEEELAVCDNLTRLYQLVMLAMFECFFRADKQGADFGPCREVLLLALM